MRDDWGWGEREKGRGGGGGGGEGGEKGCSGGICSEISPTIRFFILCSIM